VEFYEKKTEQPFRQRVARTLQKFRLVGFHVNFEQVHSFDAFLLDELIQCDPGDLLSADRNVAEPDEAAPSGMSAVGVVKRDRTTCVSQRDVVTVKPAFIAIQPAILNKPRENV